MDSGIISAVEPEPVRLVSPGKRHSSGAIAVRRRKWIRVRVQIELPEDADAAARQVLHLARMVDAHKAALMSVTDELQQTTALNSVFQQRIQELTNRMAEAALTGNLAIIGGAKRQFTRKRTIRGGGGMRKAGLKEGPSSGPGTG